MRQTLLVAFAGLGVLATGCTNAPAGQPGTATPVTVTTTEQTPTPGRAAQQTVTDIQVGAAAWLVTKLHPFETSSSGCVLRGDAVVDVVGQIDGNSHDHTLLVEHMAESEWQVTNVKTSQWWSFTEGSNMRGILMSDDACPQIG